MICGCGRAWVRIWGSVWVRGWGRHGLGYLIGFGRGHGVECGVQHVLGFGVASWWWCEVDGGA